MSEPTAQIDTGISHASSPEAFANLNVEGFEAGDEIALEPVSMEELEMLEAHSSGIGASEIEADDYADIDVPHLLFNSQLLRERLIPMMAVIKDRQEIVSKSVWIKPDIKNGVVHFIANTGEFKVKVKVTLENTQNVLEDDLIVEFKILMGVLKNSGSRLALKYVDKVLHASVLGGDVEFDT